MNKIGSQAITDTLLKLAPGVSSEMRGKWANILQDNITSQTGPNSNRSYVYVPTMHVLLKVLLWSRHGCYSDTRRVLPSRCLRIQLRTYQQHMRHSTSIKQRKIQVQTDATSK